ncbi:hypothetical protein LZC95_00385 [Pendulispora brunnea]|uniref:Tetratricopeptide repeat protein n=1 Tax=Pendulispora brunnea TaxID=2905690 RepID=A0ABZ2K9D0_9BACT
MQRLFRAIETRLREFIEQRDDFLLVLRCPDEQCAYVAKILQGVDESTEHAFWTFGDEFHEATAYADTIAKTFYQRVELLNAKLVEDGESPWPPLPPRLLDRQTHPVERIRILFLYARKRIDDLETSRLVVALTPLHIGDLFAWRAFLRELVQYDPASPWCHHMRLIARESAGIDFAASYDAQAMTDPAQYPSTQVHDVDLSVAALQASLKEETADRNLPLAERANALLMDAMVDYGHRRYVPAMEKYRLLQTFFGTLRLDPMLALTLNGIGEVLAATGFRNEAVQHFEMAMTPAIESKSYAVLLNITLNLANLYLTHEWWSKALEYYTSAEKLATTLLNVHIKLLCLENIGFCHQRMGDPGAAQKAWQDGVTLARGTEEDATRKRLLLHLRELYQSHYMADRVHAVEHELRGLP